MAPALKDSIRDSLPWAADGYRSARRRWNMARTRRELPRLLAGDAPLWIDLGGGDTPMKGWVSVDVTPKCQVYWDLRWPLPFPNDSVDRIYSSHLLEHLTFQEGQVLLAQCLRVLKPGGEISICVPNARRFIDSYLGVTPLPRDEFGGTDAYFETTPIDALNYVAYMGGHHKYMFDQENLLFRLQSIGFVDVGARPFDATIDLPQRQIESIYAHGFAPGRSS